MFCRNLFKTSSKCRAFFKTSSRRLAKVSSRHFSTYHQVKLFFLTRLQDVFDIFLKHTTKTIIYRKIFPAHTSEKFMVNLQNFQKSTLWIHIDTFKFFKKNYEVTVLQTKISLLKSDIRNDVAVSVNKESINKSSSKIVFLSF